MIQAPDCRAMIAYAALGALLISALSCTQVSRLTVSQLHTPSHHAEAGLKLLEQGKHVDAERAFTRALLLDDSNAPANAGMSRVKTDEGRFEEARRYLEMARRLAITDEDRLIVHVSAIRFYARAKPQTDWLRQAQNEFNAAVAIDRQCVQAYDEMVLARKDACDFYGADQLLMSVAVLNPEARMRVQNERERIEKAARALPKSALACRLVWVDRLTRADAAALLVEQFDIASWTSREGKEALDDPRTGVEVAAADAKPKAGDIAAHALRKDIETVLKADIRGLENYPDGRFHPEQWVSRAAFALILYDLLRKASPNTTVVISQEAHVNFPDIRPDAPYLNAVNALASRGIMGTFDNRTGNFAPLRAVSGADAIWMMRRLKDDLDRN